MQPVDTCTLARITGATQVQVLPQLYQLCKLIYINVTSIRDILFLRVFCLVYASVNQVTDK
jgi:hypothetical protein